MLVSIAGYIGSLMKSRPKLARVINVTQPVVLRILGAASVQPRRLVADRLGAPALIRNGWSPRGASSLDLQPPEERRAPPWLNIALLGSCARFSVSGCDTPIASTQGSVTYKAGQQANLDKSCVSPTQHGIEPSYLIHAHTMWYKSSSSVWTLSSARRHAPPRDHCNIL